MVETIQDSLVDPSVRRNPFEFYRTLREKAPVYMMRGTDFYFVSDFDIATKILRDPENFSNEFPEGQTSFVNFSPEADKLLAEKGYGRRVKTVVFSDPPIHTKYRRLVSDALRPSVVRAMAPKIRTVVTDLLADIKEDGVVDVVKALLVPLPMFILADWMGVDREDYESFKKWSLAANYTLQPPLPQETLMTYAETIAEMQHYLAGMMEVRRKEPKEDLISELLQADLGGERKLTDKEILSLLETLLVAGNETTTNAIGNAMLVLAQDPELQKTLREDKSLILRFIEEALRTQSSVTGVFKRTKVDMELGGVAIPAGAKILVGLAAANRDDKQFDHADAVDLERGNARTHLAFGNGFHTCLGNNLARLEMQLFFELFLDEYESFSLAIPEEEVKYLDLMGLRGLAELPLNLVHARDRATA